MDSTVTRSQPTERFWDAIESENFIIDVYPTNLHQLCDALMSTWTKIFEECFQNFFMVKPCISKMYLIQCIVYIVVYYTIKTCTSSIKLIIHNIQTGQQAEKPWPWITSLPNMHNFGPRNEAKVPGENSVQAHGEHADSNLGPSCCEETLLRYCITQFFKKKKY